VRSALAITATFAGLAAVGPVAAADRAEALAGAFQRWCLSNTPSFKALDDQAAASRGLAVNHGKRVTICGVAAPDAPGEAVRNALSQPDRLGAPIATRNSDDGVQRITEFKAPYAYSSILLADGTPQNDAGVILNITEVRELGR
jgi:hypothetical protein